MIRMRLDFMRRWLAGKFCSPIPDVDERDDYHGESLTWS
jgi:malate synthase